MKKWTVEELNNAIEMHGKKFKFNEIADILNRSKKSVKEKLNSYGLNENVDDYNVDSECLKCGNEFTSKKCENRKFCSHKCSATYNNKARTKKEKNNCLFCNKETTGKFCSHRCHWEYDKAERFRAIENGIHSGDSVSNRWHKEYLIEKYGNKCMKCGWNEINPKTNKVPIQLEHIDGNSDNNELINLLLLCPNCHSLTLTYCALNKGNGRSKIKERRNQRYHNDKNNTKL